jgi:cystathionine beta-synthase
MTSKADISSVYRDSILSCVGGTPLVKLNKVLDDSCATVLAKCEFLNPTGSIKDRIAAHIVAEAERDGRLKPGGMIVENTSGNTGLGLAMVAAVKGYRCVFTMPDKMSQEKISMLKSFGAEVVITPTDVPGDSPEHYVNTAKRIAAETPGAFYVNQYHCKENIDAHFHSTGAEIWEQTNGGTFDAFVAGTGTGGTVSGVGRYFKQKKSGVKIVGVDPIGSVHYHYFYTQSLSTPHVYKVEGIGEDILCDAMDFSVVDEMRQVNDRESFDMARRLVREEGLFCGGSSGSTVKIAVDLAREMGPGHTIVVILCDSASRYITKYLSDSWMKDYGFLEPASELGLVEELVEKLGPLVTARPSDTMGHVIGLMRDKGISQVPLVCSKGKPQSIVHEVDILHALRTGEVNDHTEAKEIAKPIGGLIYPKARIEELYRIFETDQVAFVVDANELKGVISKIDLIDYITATHNTGARSSLRL